MASSSLRIGALARVASTPVASRPPRGRATPPRVARTTTVETISSPRGSDASAPGRRASLFGLAAAAAAATSSRPPRARAEISTPKGYDDPGVTTGGFNAWASTSDAIGCAYVIEWPSGWCALSDLSSARTVGVDASFKNPADEASTLAVFVSDVPVGQRSVADQGSLDALARSRADSAPRQQNIGKRKRKTPLASGGGDALTYDIETKVGGGTAGRFGAAVELVSITVVGGKEYLIRATASASSWPGEKARLRRAVESFAFTGKC
jgi:hypothetical protein